MSLSLLSPERWIVFRWRSLQTCAPSAMHGSCRGSRQFRHFASQRDASAPRESYLPQQRGLPAKREGAPGVPGLQRVRGLPFPRCGQRRRADAL